MEVRTPDPPRLPKHVPAKNAPDFTLPNKDTPKTCPVLGANPCRRTFRSVCFCALHGYTQKIVWFHISPSGHTKNAPGFRPKPSSQDISGRMLLRPTRVRAKPARFHISAPGYTKNAPDFRPKPSARDFSGRMLLRPYTGTCKTSPVSYFRTRIHQKRTSFHPSQ